MDPTAFAQGLITYANLELYKKARVNFPPPTNYEPPKEPVAVQLLENILNKVVFAGDKYKTVTVNSQIPPHENSDLACDLAIRYVTNSNMEIRTLCFIEAKRTINQPRYLTKHVEDGALKYCKEYLFSNSSTGTVFVYAGTLVGAYLKLWVVRRTQTEAEMKLSALWGSEDSGSSEEYKDLGDYHDGQLLMKTFHKMVDIAPKTWINASADAIAPTPNSGAYQLPSLIGGQRPLLRTNPTLPRAGEIPDNFERVARFTSTNNLSFSWQTTSGKRETGGSHEWTVVQNLYVNSKRNLYADRGTGNLPIQLSFPFELVAVQLSKLSGLAYFKSFLVYLVPCSSLQMAYHLPSSPEARFDSNTAFRSDCDAVITRSIVFQEHGHMVYLEDLDIEIHDHLRRKARYAPSVHSLCQAAAVDPPSLRIIYDLGLAMIPLEWTGLPQEIYRNDALSKAVSSLPTASRGNEGESDLCNLLKGCGKLPLELTIIIWDFLASGPVRCLLALNAANRVWSSPSLLAGNATISLHEDFVVYFTHLMKGKYVCGIRQGHTLCGHESSSSVMIQMPASSAECVFSLGIYGLRKIEFLTETRTNSTSKRDLAMDGLEDFSSFCSNEGFVGLGTHFCSPSQSASRSQNSSVYCSIYVYWHESDALSTSYLAIKTIRNRMFILGPQFSPSKMVMRCIANLDDGDILGLYYDASPGITSFTSLGAICRPNKLSVTPKRDHFIPEMLPNRDMTRFLYTSPFISFISQASSKNITMIKACYVNSRCTGMLLLYNDDRSCILGQWYENTHVQPEIQAISLQNDGFLRFFFEKEDRRQFITHVNALTGTPLNETGVMFIDVTLGDEIIWMFSGDSDIIFYGSE
ncbi:hypothetical protein BO78DRAFT_389316 [Aspergillus sclerotiicarbonarius CBS 121057]|uniref:Uncharacterized protein n=1 Tax=Aspergillus sclerotiicarbonarius (strain CBS 121057 / IBT 28362) TaxID=1448318 RepID=A0A319E0S0_ASPSB|nr:hypothetical protein BO78DRAFT_389316 [Aspergillus sclerotiicarbonarius CBS 121057]